MCITVLSGDLGAAQAGLDLSLLTMVLSPDLDPDDRVFAARWMLTRAGVPQPDDELDTVVCLCGSALSLESPAAIGQSEPAKPAFLPDIIPSPLEFAFELSFLTGTREELSLLLPA